MKDGCFTSSPYGLMSWSLWMLILTLAQTKQRNMNPYHVFFSAFVYSEFLPNSSFSNKETTSRDMNSCLVFLSGPGYGLASTFIRSEIWIYNTSSAFVHVEFLPNSSFSNKTKPRRRDESMSRIFVWARVRITVSIYEQQDMGKRAAAILDLKPSMRKIKIVKWLFGVRCLIWS